MKGLLSTVGNRLEVDRMVAIEMECQGLLGRGAGCAGLVPCK